MKTLKLFSMVALAFAMLGCNKEKFANVDKVPVQEGKKLSFTATIAAPTETKTTYTEDGTSIRVTWKVNDQIALVHNGVKDVATVTAVDGSGKATIEATNITGSPSDNDEVILVYPADAVASAVAQSPFPFTPDPACWDKVKGGQDGTLEYIQDNIDFRMGSGKLAVSGDAVTLKESVKVPSMICVWKLTLQDEASNPIAATSLTVRKGDDRQAVANCAEAKSTFYLCLVPSQLIYASGEYFAIDAVVGSDTYTFTKTGSLSLAESKYYQSTVKMKLVKPDLLSGVFSVSGSKTVKFSKGNLRYASDTWSFFDNQYDYYNSHNADAWDHFGWSTSATTYGMSTSETISDYSGDFVDWGATMGTGWFTLSKDEWTYLFNTRSASTVNGTANGRYAKAEVNGVMGVILFPDTYTHPDGVTAPVGVNVTGNTGWDGNSYTVADWTKMESAGCVFLPATGSRNGSTMNMTGWYGYYWSATLSGTFQAYYVSFIPNSLNVYSYNRCTGYSVRLVREVTE